MEPLTIGAAARHTGWSPRMLRYLEQSGLVEPQRSAGGYRRYGLIELNRLRSLRELLGRFGVEIGDVAFAARLRRDAALRVAVDSWLAGLELEALEWEQAKHERLLVA
jgi:MerR family transcriptional regulator, copper efflux regulator